MKIKQTTKALKVLDFDIENRPLSYWYDGNPTAEITAIAWSWVGSDRVDSMLLTKRGTFVDSVDGVEFPDFRFFIDAYNEADMVVGHYIRNHDLPIINGALMENRMPPLSAKLTHCTKNDLVRRSGLSMSQEALAAMYELDSGKYHMTQQMWRDANRLTPEGLKLTRKRVIDDVKQHKELYRTLKQHGVLKAPKEWKP